MPKPPFEVPHAYVHGRKIDEHVCECAICGWPPQNKDVHFQAEEVRDANPPGK